MAEEQAKSNAQAIEDSYAKPFRRELNILQKFTDGFNLPETAVLDAGFTNHGSVGVGFTSPNAVVHFVPIEARFNEEELATIQSLNQGLRAGQVKPDDVINYRTASHPDKERVGEIIAKSREIRDAQNDAGQFHIAQSSMRSRLKPSSTTLLRSTTKQSRLMPPSFLFLRWLLARAKAR